MESEDVVLQEFWALTVSGAIYHCSSEVNHRGMPPKVTKVYAYGGNEPKTPVGALLGGGTTVAITKDDGIMLYFPSLKGGRRHTAWGSSTSHHGGKTSPIVGLFLTEDAAYKAWRLYQLPWDWTCLTASLEVLVRIPPDHPIFVIDEPVQEMVAAIHSLIQPNFLPRSVG